MKIFLNWLLISFIAADLLVGLSLKSFFPLDSTYYWIGSILIAFDTFVSGVVLFIGAATSEEFTRKLKSISDTKVVVSRSKRIAWVVAGFLLTILGAFLFINQIVQFGSHCPDLIC
jgi:hypothetical protein